MAVIILMYNRVSTLSVAIKQEGYTPCYTLEIDLEVKKYFIKAMVTFTCFMLIII